MTSARRLVEVTAACLGVVVVMSSTPSAVDDVMDRARATYAALRSYADTGVVIKEYGTASTDEYKFTTRFNRAPRGFYLEIEGGRYVIWADPNAFHTWWRDIAQQTDYPNPNNAPAITQSGQHARGLSDKIPTLLYANAALGGSFVNFADRIAEGIDALSGHRCHRIVGTARDVYSATGRESNVRKMTVWVDVDSFLIRKVLEEWAPLPGQRSRVTTVFEPTANPTIDQADFRFKPPAPRLP